MTSATQIQVDTGLTFFTSLPSEVAAALRSKVDGQTNPPPAVVSFTPTTGAAGTSVTILGTNFSSATAVAVNGASALFTLDSEVQITAVIPTNASSGALSITTPSGTAVSTNPFTVLVNGGTLYSGTLVAWNFNGVTNFGASPFAPTTSATNLVLTGLARGSGVRTNASGAGGGWGGAGFTNVTDASAIASNQFVTFSVAATNGYKLSFTSLSRFDYYRSLTGPTNGLLQYQIGTSAFSNVATFYYSVVGSGASNSPIDLSTFAELQNIGAGTNVTFRLVNYGGTSSLGTWYLYDRLGTSAPDFAVNGIVTQVVTPVIPPPTLSITLQSSQVILFWPTNATGFVLQQNTNLLTTNWTAFTGSLAISGTNRTATVTNPVAAQFFRLSLP